MRLAPDLAVASADDWVPIVAGAETVVHLAAALPWDADGSIGHLRAVNVGGTRALAQASRAVGVSRFIFVSTLGVHGTTCGDTPFRPQDPPDPSGAYAQTKYEAEEALKEHSGAMVCIVVRPPVVYGPGVGGKIGALIQRIANGRRLPFGRLDTNRRQMIGSDNLADLLLRACRLETAPPHPLLPADAEAVSTAELIRRIAEAFGAEPKSMPVPAAAFSLAARLPVIGGLARRLVGDVRVEDAYLRDEMRWTPPLSLDEGLSRLARSSG